jgi:hypothetical protein
MPLTIRDPEVMGVTASSVTLAFRVEDAAGAADATARVLLDGELRARSEGAARAWCASRTRPDTEYTLTIEVVARRLRPGPLLPERVRTLVRAPPHRHLAMERPPLASRALAASSPPTTNTATRPMVSR